MFISWQHLKKGGVRLVEGRALTCKNSQTEVEVLQAGGKWAQDETSSCQQATQHDPRLTGQLVTDNTPKRSFKNNKQINRKKGFGDTKALKRLWCCPDGDPRKSGPCVTQIRSGTVTELRCPDLDTYILIPFSYSHTSRARVWGFLFVLFLCAWVFASFHACTSCVCLVPVGIRELIGS